MSSIKEKKVYVDLHDLYQFLISECRYGYKRNNHLMPGGAYDHVKEYLPKMLKANKDMALHTARQLCEECISDQLTANFYEGLDDEFGNRKEAVEFVNWCMEWIRTNSGSDAECTCHTPYNYDIFESNLTREEELKYRVFEIDKFEEDADVIREITTEPVSKNDADNVLFLQELGVTSGVTNHIVIRDQHSRYIVGELVRIVEPESHKGHVYSIKLSK
jgi:hypothetical protein